MGRYVVVFDWQHSRLLADMNVQSLILAYVYCLDDSSSTQCMFSFWVQRRCCWTREQLSHPKQTVQPKRCITCFNDKANVIDSRPNSSFVSCKTVAFCKKREQLIHFGSLFNRVEAESMYVSLTVNCCDDGLIIKLIYSHKIATSTL